MVSVEAIWVENYPFTATHVALPKTNLLVVSNHIGYVMCGALDISLLREQLAHREIIAARATGVKTMADLLEGTVESCTQTAETLGIQVGMSIQAALAFLGQEEQRKTQG